jgi:hypothetical protein
MLKLISGLILLVVVLFFAQWWFQYEGFRISATQAACEKAYNECMKKAVTGDDAKLCNSTYTNCMGFPTDTSGAKFPTVSNVYGRDGSGNRVILVSQPTTDTKTRIDEYKKVADATLKGTTFTNPALGPYLGSGSQTLVGYSQLGLYPTQDNLDKAQGADFLLDDKGATQTSTEGTPTTTGTESKTGSGTPIKTTIPPAGMTDSVKNQIKRDTVDAVRSELKKLFEENEFMYKIEE